MLPAKARGVRPGVEERARWVDEVGSAQVLSCVETGIAGAAGAIVKENRGVMIAARGLGRPAQIGQGLDGGHARRVDPLRFGGRARGAVLRRTTAGGERDGDEPRGREERDCGPKLGSSIGHGGRRLTKKVISAKCAALVGVLGYTWVGGFGTGFARNLLRMGFRAPYSALLRDQGAESAGRLVAFQGLGSAEIGAGTEAKRRLCATGSKTIEDAP